MAYLYATNLHRAGDVFADLKIRVLSLEIQCSLAGDLFEGREREDGITNSLCCSVLQCVAVCCSVLQCVAVSRITNSL